MRTVQTTDIRTYYEQRRSGPPLVFIHGAVIADHASWTRQLHNFSDEYATFAYPVCGHGRTEGSSLPTYAISPLTDEGVIRVLPELADVVNTMTYTTRRQLPQ